MLQLRAYASPERADMVGRRLAAIPGVRHVIIGARTEGNLVQLSGELDAGAAEVVLDVLGESELGPDDIVLWRSAENISPIGWGRSGGGAARGSVLWAEVTGRATQHARPALLYVLYMGAAGIVAGVGVLNGSAILVVGAMALSPDLLPLSAAAVGLVERRWGLFARASMTLWVGLGIATVTAAGATIVLRIFGRIDEGLELADTALGPSLTEVGPGAILVALAAGVAGILAYETPSGAAVGVAISVTTIPAAAFLGCSIGLVTIDDGIGALEVLITNVVFIQIAAALTLVVQRSRRRRATTTTRGTF